MKADALQQEIMAALKAGNSVRAETLRFLLSAVRNYGIEKYGSAADTSLTDADTAEVAKKQVKTHRESVEAFEKAGRTELVAKEKAELAVLEEFAPKELGDEELKALLAPIAATGEKNFGLLMKQAMAATGGQADGGRVSQMLRALMSA